MEVTGGHDRSLCQVYVGELSCRHHRGWLLAVSAPATALGSLALHTAASALPWHCAAAGAAVVPAVMAVRWVQVAASAADVLLLQPGVLLGQPALVRP